MSLARPARSQPRDQMRQQRTLGVVHRLRRRRVGQPGRQRLVVRRATAVATSIQPAAPSAAASASPVMSPAPARQRPWTSSPTTPVRACASSQAPTAPGARISPVDLEPARRARCPRPAGSRSAGRAAPGTPARRTGSARPPGPSRAAARSGTADRQLEVADQRVELAGCGSRRPGAPRSESADLAADLVGVAEHVLQPVVGGQPLGRGLRARRRGRRAGCRWSRRPARPARGSGPASPGTSPARSAGSAGPGRRRPCAGRAR